MKALDVVPLKLRVVNTTGSDGGADLKNDRLLSFSQINQLFDFAELRHTTLEGTG